VSKKEWRKPRYSVVSGIRRDTKQNIRKDVKSIPELEINVYIKERKNQRRKNRVKVKRCKESGRCSNKGRIEVNDP
jgi:hypothetical protein